MTCYQDSEHEFKGTWRWPDSFESWVEDLVKDVDGQVVNIGAGLSPLGDVQVDLKTPTELITSLQKDSGTNLERARKYLQDHIAGTPTVDVVSSLLAADDPPTHPAAEHISTDGQRVRADIFSTLPFNDNTFQWTLADPPWIGEISPAVRERLFGELVRITEPGGQIVHNAFWIPTGDYAATLDKLVPRQDTERWSVGTPKVSWVGVYTVHSSVEITHHLSRTLPSREHAPEPGTVAEAVRAQIDFELQCRHGFKSGEYDLDAVDPTDNSKQCPKCSCQKLNPVGDNAGPHAGADSLYECEQCRFRAFDDELQAPTNQNPQISQHTL